MAMKAFSQRRKHSVIDYALSISNISALIYDANWRKAVFYRDPLSRFLSAYRSKCERIDPDGAIWCSNAFGISNISFHEAVSQAYSYRIKIDPHFAKQSSFCGGLALAIAHFQDVHELDKSSTRENFIHLLNAMRLPYRGSSEFAVKVNKLLPPVDIDKARTVARFTHSHEEKNLKEYFTKQCYIRTIVDYYQDDYNAFRIKYPRWAMAALRNTSRESCLGLKY